MFLGEDITRILESIAEGHDAVHNDGSRMDTGVAAVPDKPSEFSYAYDFTGKVLSVACV